MPATCTIDDCDKPARSRGYCQAHYMRAYRSGDPLFPLKHQRRGEGCDVEGCDRPHQALGYCITHYRRLKTDGDVGDAAITPHVANAGLTCAGPDCTDPAKSKGLCGAHYLQQHEGKPLTPKRRHIEPGGPCSVEECSRAATIEGMCRAHRVRWIKAQKGEPSSKALTEPVADKAPSGEGYIDASSGYRYITVNGKQQREHRVMMAELVGRALLGTETVHHVNGNRAENRTGGPLEMDERGRLRSGNLELWSSAQPAGQEIGPKLAWAREMLALYGTGAERAAYAGLLPPEARAEG